jgi:putative tryptophan/tyrosine transport system substrate-binding protein
MNRRRFVGLAAGALWLTRYAWAQPSPIKQVAVLLAGSRETDELATAPFFDQMRRLGWIEGRNISYERFFALGSRDKMVELARAAAAKSPDLVYAPTGHAAGSATKATKTIPVVFVTVSDPMVIGLVASLARPGGNATGTFQIQADLVAKRFEMVREAMPRLKRIGVLLDTRSTEYIHQKQRHQEAARAFGFDVSMGDYSSFDEAGAALARFEKEQIQVATCASSFTIISRRKELIELTRRSGIALIAHRVEWAEAGALLSYGADVNEALRRSAEIAHRVLNGARPADTPVEQASKFELIVNLRAANELGIVLPKLLLARADRVIE